MKIKSDKDTSFQPIKVIITLENQAEVDIISKCVGEVTWEVCSRLVSDAGLTNVESEEPPIDILSTFFGNLWAETHKYATWGT